MSRGDKAKAYFLQGYNCSQSVALSFSDFIDMDDDSIALFTSGFGGGMGRMREVCGAVSGAVFVISSVKGYKDPSDYEGKKKLYEEIQKFCKEFQNKNGSIVCRELLGIEKNKSDSPIPEKRSEEYYKKRPCPELIKMSADILEKQLVGNID